MSHGNAQLALEGNKALVLRWFDEVWNQGRRETIKELFAAQGVLHDGVSTYRGPEEFTAFYEKLRAQFSKFSIRPIVSLAEGDHACVHWSGWRTCRERFQRLTNRTRSSRSGRAPGRSKIVSRRRERAGTGVFHRDSSAERDRLLHIGHMLDHTEIDILTRWRRMQGYNTLYLPGTDHAGISTQRVVVRQLPRAASITATWGAKNSSKVWELEGRIRRHDHAADAAARRELRLDARAVHAFAGDVARGDRSFRAALRGRADLSRALHRELVSAMPHGAQRSRNRSRGAAGASLAHPLSDRGDEGIYGRGHHAAGNDAGRYRPWPCIPSDPRYPA
jgi:hypothetical protein